MRIKYILTDNEKIERWGDEGWSKAMRVYILEKGISEDIEAIHNITLEDIRPYLEK